MGFTLRLFFLTALVVMVGCVPGEQPTQFNTYTEIEKDKAICDPFGNKDDSIVTDQNGVLALLYSAGKAKGASVYNYMKPEMLVSNSVVFSKINVPTRNFSEGFSSNNGEALKDQSGQKLIEYFALAFKGRIKLDPTLDEQGVYEFAVLSDDGSVFKIHKNGTGLVTNVNNDGQTSTRMGCASEVVDMNYQSKLEFQLDYYQGPRTRIAAVLMFRKVADSIQDYQINGSKKSSFCGKSSESNYFESDGRISNGLADEGFKPLVASNFLLPKGISKNPCVK